MNEFAVDLDAYFARIGYHGPRTPDLDVLKRIVLLHHCAIAFENLNSFSGLPVMIDPAGIEKKIVRSSRGGYCHEQNQYLRLVLLALGFDARLRMARVRWMLPPEVTPARAHMTLNVAVRGHWYLCDVGFGAMTPTAPLRLDTADEQPTPHETYRVIRKGESYYLEVKLGEHWRPVFSFDEVHFYPIDFEAANWFVSTHLESIFVKDLIVVRPTADRRQILNNTAFSIRHSDGNVDKRNLADLDELRSILTTIFGLVLPNEPKIDHALAGLFTNKGHQ